MSTYRVGNHQPQNVYRESDDDPCPASVDGRCAESGEIHPPCKRGECRYDQTGARRGRYIGVMFTAEDAALVVEALNGGDFHDSVCTGPGVPAGFTCSHPSHAADSCTCPTPYRSSTAPDPACPVHQGRRARGPKPPPVGPGCICDGSGRTCPRHGAVL